MPPTRQPILTPPQEALVRALWEAGTALRAIHRTMTAEHGYTGALMTLSRTIVASGAGDPSRPGTVTKWHNNASRQTVVMEAVQLRRLLAPHTPPVRRPSAGDPPPMVRYPGPPGGFTMLGRRV
jgi:hypothetical protein